MKPAVTAFLIIMTALLSGCSSTPDRAEVAERYAIEMAGAFGGGSTKDDWIELGEGIADSALKGMCGEDTFRSTAFEGNPSALAAWDNTCLMYFEGDMSSAQIERAKQSLIGQLAD